MTSDEKIIKLLVDTGKVEKKALVGVFKIHNANHAPLEKLVVDLKVVSRQDVLEAKARIFGAEPYLIDVNKINMDIAKNIPQAMAKRYMLICPGLDENGRMIIAMHDPSDTFALEYVQVRTGKEVRPYVALLADLENAWDRIYMSELMAKKMMAKKIEEPKSLRRVIPEKLIIPGLSSKSTVIVENPEKAQSEIRHATEMMREKARDDSSLNTVVDSIQNELNVLSILSHAVGILNSVTDENEVVKRILETGLKVCNAEAGSILMLEEGKQFLYFKESVGPKSNELLKVKVPLNEESIAGWVALNRMPLAVNSPKEDPRHYKAIDNLVRFETKNLAAVPLTWGGELIGVMEIINTADGDFSEKDIEHLNILAFQASVALHNSLMIEQLKNFYLEVVEILIDCLEIIDPMTRDHSVNTARIAAAIAKEINLSGKEYENIMYGAFLHDIGKIKVSSEKMENHPMEGAQMLSHVTFFRDIIPIVRHHHEKYDGSGYPDGLAGENIPLGARIIAIAEGYLEMKRDNPDMPDDELLKEFLTRFGSVYDPNFRQAFENICCSWTTEK